MTDGPIERPWNLVTDDHTVAGEKIVFENSFEVCAPCVEHGAQRGVVGDAEAVNYSFPAAGVTVGQNLPVAIGEIDSIEAIACRNKCKVGVG